MPQFLAPNGKMYWYSDHGMNKSKIGRCHIPDCANPFLVDSIERHEGDPEFCVAMILTCQDHRHSFREAKEWFKEHLNQIRKSKPATYKTAEEVATDT